MCRNVDSGTQVDGTAFRPVPKAEAAGVGPALLWYAKIWTQPYAGRVVFGGQRRSIDDLGRFRCRSECGFRNVREPNEAIGIQHRVTQERNQ